MVIQKHEFKINQEKWAFKDTILSFSIDNTVEVTKYRHAGLKFTKVCAEIGGALGLWLGLRIIQLFHQELPDKIFVPVPVHQAEGETQGRPARCPP